jgi:hypothetical protein
MKRTSAKAGDHSDVISLATNSAIAERCLKRAQAREWVPPEQKRADQSWSALEDTCQPTAEERQSGRVVLKKIEREQAKAMPRTGAEEPNAIYNCPGLKATRQKLVHLARWRGYSTAADDIANNCFVAALNAKTKVNCLCRFAQHGRAFRWALAREDRDTVKYERRARDSAERMGPVMVWVKDEDGTDEGHFDGYIPADEGLQRAALDRDLDLTAVIKASPRPHTKLAVAQIMSGVSDDVNMAHPRMA